MRVTAVLLWCLTALLLIAAPVHAQDTTPEPDGGPLAVRDVVVASETNAFGQEVLVARGILDNLSETDAYTDLSLFADVLDASGEPVGEGFGFAADACGLALLPDFALQPGHSQSFIITLELFEDDAAYENVVVSPDGTPVEPTADSLPDSFAGITQAATGEVVMVEWVDETTLRYAIGCHGEVFTQHTWYQYDVTSGESVSVEHPAIARINPDLLAVIGLSDPMAYERSFLTFPVPVGQRRIIYQSDINVVNTAELDGSFRRLIWDDLSRVSLQGFIWLPISRFMAYYYGAYGELVRYFTASLEGQRISDSVYEVVPSIIVPGPTPDGAQAVIAIEEEGTVGYYLQSTVFEARELLFEGDAPGNNYPAPIYTVDEAENAYVYLIRPLEGRPVLQCFDMQARSLSDLTVVPLQLDTQHRGWTWLSPDETTLALAANGVDGGLWLIDLEAFGGCTPVLEG